MEFSNDISALFLFGLISIALWFLYFSLFQQYKVDKTRQELFAIRDEMFDFAAAGFLSFNHPAYIMLRHTMNGMIRVAHRINWYNTIIIVLFMSREIKKMDFGKRFKEAQSGLDSATMGKLDDYLERMNITVAMHIIKSSILLYIVLFVAKLLSFFLKGLGQLVQIIVSKFPGIAAIDNKAFYEKISYDKGYCSDSMRTI